MNKPKVKPIYMATLNQSGFSSTNFPTPRANDKNVTKVGASMINMTTDDSNRRIPGQMQCDANGFNIDNKPHNKIIKAKAVAISEDHLSSLHCCCGCVCWTSGDGK